MKVEELTKEFHDLLLELNQLVEENNNLVNRAQVNLGARLVAHILALPFEKVGILGELIQRFFTNQVSDQLIEAAEDFMRQYWSNKNRIEHLRGRFHLIKNELEKASDILNDAEKKLDECEKRGLQTV